MPFSSSFAALAALKASGKIVLNLRRFKVSKLLLIKIDSLANFSLLNCLAKDSLTTVESSKVKPFQGI
jgi:hypothetical protein